MEWNWYNICFLLTFATWVNTTAESYNTRHIIPCISLFSFHIKLPLNNIAWGICYAMLSIWEEWLVHCRNTWIYTDWTYRYGHISLSTCFYVPLCNTQQVQYASSLEMTLFYDDLHLNSWTGSHVRVEWLGENMTERYMNKSISKVI